MKRLIFVSLSTLVLSIALMPTVSASACPTCTSTGPTNPSPGRGYISAGE